MLSRGLKTSILLFVAGAACTGAALGCDLCSIYAAAQAQGETGQGWFGGVAEQFTHFGTLQHEGRTIPGYGEYIDSSVSQLFAGYNFKNWLGAQINLPLIYRGFGSDSRRGTEAGVGDLSLLGTIIPYQKLSEKFTFNWSVVGGVKFPTGDSARLGAPDEAFPEGIAGHDVALGSGSFDGLVGTGAFGRWGRLFASASLQYAIRTEGDFHHRYANDLTWQAGPGVYLAMTHYYTLSLQGIVSGETKGKDTFRGVPDEDSAATLVYLGPQLNFTWGSRLSAQAGVDLPVTRQNSGTQVLPDYRVRASVTVRF